MTDVLVDLDFERCTAEVGCTPLMDASAPLPAPQPAAKAHRLYDFVVAAFVTILLCSNIIGATKVVTVAGLTFGAGILFFPLSYVFGDVLTEVYGFAKSRRAVWSGFVALGFASAMSAFIVAVPPARDWKGQEQLAFVFGQTPRIAAASMVAYFCGEFVNSYVLAKMKLLTNGRHLWTRIIGSTIAGEGVDSIVFYPLAFYGVWTNELVLTVMVTNYLLKVGWEVILTPVTYRIVALLKRVEHEDYFDWHTNFSPFHLRE